MIKKKRKIIGGDFHCANCLLINPRVYAYQYQSSDDICTGRLGEAIVFRRTIIPRELHLEG